MKHSKQNANKTLLITWKWIGDDAIEQTEATSAGLAMLEADWCVEVLRVEPLQ